MSWGWPGQDSSTYGTTASVDHVDNCLHLTLFMTSDLYSGDLWLSCTPKLCPNLWPLLCRWTSAVASRLKRAHWRLCKATVRVLQRSSREGCCASCLPRRAAGQVNAGKQCNVKKDGTRKEALDPTWLQAVISTFLSFLSFQNPPCFCQLHHLFRNFGVLFSPVILWEYNLFCL